MSKIIDLTKQYNLIPLDPSLVVVNQEWHNLEGYLIPAGYPQTKKAVKMPNGFYRAAIKLNPTCVVFSNWFYEDEPAAIFAAEKKIKEMKGN